MAAELVIRKVRTGSLAGVQLSRGKRMLAFNRADWLALLQACHDGTRSAYAAANVVFDSGGVTLTDSNTKTVSINNASWDMFVIRVRTGEFDLALEDG